MSDDALLGDPAQGARIVEWIAERATLGLCALQLGVAEEALQRARVDRGQVCVAAEASL